MTRSVALRALTLFVMFAALFASVGIASHVPVAEALFLISASFCGLMLLFVVAMPAPAPVPVRVRRRQF